MCMMEGKIVAIPTPFFQIQNRLDIIMINNGLVFWGCEPIFMSSKTVSPALLKTSFKKVLTKWLSDMTYLWCQTFHQSFKTAYFMVNFTINPTCIFSLRPDPFPKLWSSITANEVVLWFHQVIKSNSSNEISRQPMIWIISISLQTLLNKWSMLEWWLKEDSVNAMKFGWNLHLHYKHR